MAVTLKCYMDRSELIKKNKKQYKRNYTRKHQKKTTKKKQYNVIIQKIFLF